MNKDRRGGKTYSNNRQKPIAATAAAIAGLPVAKNQSIIDIVEMNSIVNDT